MGNSHTKKSIKTLPDKDKTALTAYIFPKLEKSEIELAAKDIVLGLTCTRPDFVLTYTQCLRANRWLQEHGYAIVDLTAAKIGMN